MHELASAANQQMIVGSSAARRGLGRELGRAVRSHQRRALHAAYNEMVRNNVIQPDDGQLRVLDRLAELKDEICVYDREVRPPPPPLPPLPPSPSPPS